MLERIANRQTKTISGQLSQKRACDQRFCGKLSPPSHGRTRRMAPITVSAVNSTPAMRWMRKPDHSIGSTSPGYLRYST